ncbi:MAG TPA: hypothetical protein VHX87_03065 [Galbitalea sp.]|nr:hypothetical protein [Galbitalea sp.]
MSSEFRGIEVFGPAPRRRARQARRVRRSRLGLVSVLAGIVTVAATSTGIATSMASDFATGILLAYLATGTSVVAVLCGAASVVTGRGRRLGVIAIALGVLASPPVLTRLLDWASGLG